MSSFLWCGEDVDALSGHIDADGKTSLYLSVHFENLGAGGVERQHLEMLATDIEYLGGFVQVAGEQLRDAFEDGAHFLFRDYHRVQDAVVDAGDGDLEHAAAAVAAVSEGHGQALAAENFLSVGEDLDIHRFHAAYGVEQGVQVDKLAAPSGFLEPVHPLAHARVEAYAAYVGHVGGPVRGADTYHVLLPEGLCQHQVADLLVVVGDAVNNMK